jgi:hypothetical protein
VTLGRRENRSGIGQHDDDDQDLQPPG